MPTSRQGLLAPITPVQDLRSNSLDRQRDRETKSKWNPRWAVTGAPTAKEGPNETKRPRKLRSSKSAAQEQLWRAKRLHSVKKGNKLPAFKGDDDVWADSLVDGDIYFDSLSDEQVRGEDSSILMPASGNVVLFMAMDQAVQRYEDQETVKLVKNEYEVLTPSAEHAEANSAQTSVFDDDFELV